MKLLRDSGVAEPEATYDRLRTEWASRKDVPRELRVALTCGAATAEWLGVLATLYFVQMAEAKTPSARSQALLSCLSLLHNDLSGILRLCESGLDVQARNLLRGYIEKIDLACCLCFDSGLAGDYVGDSTFEGSRAFFHRRMSKGRMKGRAKQMVASANPDIEEMFDWLYDDWRVEVGLMLGAAEHPNHTVGIISLFPNMHRGRSKAVGLSGHPNNGSLKTIYSALLATMPLALCLMQEAKTLRDELAELRDGGDWAKNVVSLATFTLLYPIVESMLNENRKAGGDLEGFTWELVKRTV